MKKIIQTLLLVFYSSTFYSQLPNFSWAKNVSSGSLSSYAGSFATDASNNIYLIGGFSGTVDVDPSASTSNLISSGSDDISICKYNSSGNLMWAKKIGNTASEYVGSIKLDANGNIYISGITQGVTDLDPGAGTFTISGSTSSGSGFLVKLDNSGNFLWGKGLIGSTPTAYTRFNSIDVDAAGTLYATGTFDGITDFDLGPGTFTMQSSSYDIFVLKLDVAGGFLWAKKVGGVSSDEGKSIKIDASGNPVITGYFIGNTIDFDPGPSTSTLSSIGATPDVFILRLNASGNFIMAKSFGGPGSDLGYHITLDAASNIIVSGAFNGTNFDCDPGPGTYTFSSNGLDDVFCCKFDQSGNFIWGNKYGGNSDDSSNGLTTDSSNDVYLIGAFSNTIDIDPGPLTQNISSNGNYDIYITRVSSLTGNLVWGRTIGGIGVDIPHHIYVSSTNDVISSGSFESGSSIDFNTEAGTFTMTSAGSGDGYLHKMSQCLIPSPPNNTNSNITVCSPNNSINLTASGTGTLTWYNLPIGGTLLTTGNSYNTPTLAIGTHSYYVQATNSCTTSLSRTAIIVTVALTPTISVSSSNSLICIGQTATLSAGGATSYTWNTAAMSPVVAISPTVTTTYTVTGTNINGCSNMATITQSVSACTGLNNLSSGIQHSAFQVYPNPSNANFEVVMDEAAELIITNAVGQLITRQSLTTGKSIIDLSNHPNGIYFINALTKTKNYFIKIIKI